MRAMPRQQHTAPSAAKVACNVLVKSSERVGCSYLRHGQGLLGARFVFRVIILVLPAGASRLQFWTSVDFTFAWVSHFICGLSTLVV